MTNKITKYAIHGARTEADGRVSWTWWARVPWGTFQAFDTWAEASAYLAMRHHLKADHKPYRRGRNDPGRTTLGA